MCYNVNVSKEGIQGHRQQMDVDLCKICLAKFQIKKKKTKLWWNIKVSGGITDWQKESKQQPIKGSLICGLKSNFFLFCSRIKYHAELLFIMFFVSTHFVHFSYTFSCALWRKAANSMHTRMYVKVCCNMNLKLLLTLRAPAEGDPLSVGLQSYSCQQKRERL